MTERKIKIHGMMFVPTAKMVPKNLKTTKSNFEKPSKICFGEECFIGNGSNEKDFFHLKEYWLFSI